jgi:hypothetical protein
MRDSEESMDNEKCRLYSHGLILNLANETAPGLRDHRCQQRGTKRARTRTRDGMSDFVGAR